MIGFKDIPAYLVNIKAKEALELLKKDNEVENDPDYEIARACASSNEYEDLMGSEAIADEINSVKEIAQAYREGFDFVYEKGSADTEFHMAAVAYSKLQYEPDELETLGVYRKLEERVLKIGNDVKAKTALISKYVRASSAGSVSTGGASTGSEFSRTDDLAKTINQVSRELGELLNGFNSAGKSMFKPSEIEAALKPSDLSLMDDLDRAMARHSNGAETGKNNSENTVPEDRMSEKTEPENTENSKAGKTVSGLRDVNADTIFNWKI